MVPLAEMEAEKEKWNYAAKLTVKDLLSKETIKGSQFAQPYLEFSGACAIKMVRPLQKISLGVSDML